jgi:hypothetical protein
MEGKLGEYQTEFRPNKSRVDNIFILRQMYEKCYEYHNELHNAFIDFNQAFDSINRSTVIKVLKEMQIPGKIVSLVKLVTQHTKAKIKLHNEYTEQIEVKTGIKQGHPLSTVLFCTVMESLMEKFEIRENITTRLKQVCVYADDVVLVTKTKQALANTLQKLKQEAEKYGLVINQNKTKYMRHSRTQTYRKYIEIETEGMKIEEVSNVKYLGTIVTKDNLIEEEIKKRIATGNRAFFANKKIFQSKLISKKSKIKLYNALIRPVAVYGSECCALTDNIKQKLLVFERRILRRIFGPTQKADGEWRLKTNKELENAIRYENIVRHIKSKRLSWLGHVQRMPNERVAKTIYKWKSYATRPKGRPKLRWEDDARNDLRKMGVKNWKQRAQERK